MRRHTDHRVVGHETLDSGEIAASLHERPEPAEPKCELLRRAGEAEGEHAPLAGSGGAIAVETSDVPSIGIDEIERVVAGKRNWRFGRSGRSRIEEPVSHVSRHHT